jgi:hypothetical protein
MQFFVCCLDQCLVRSYAELYDSLELVDFSFQHLAVGCQFGLLLVWEESNWGVFGVLEQAAELTDC